MYRFAADGPIDAEGLGEGFRRMTDEQLLTYGKAAANMCTPEANLGHPPREPFLIQLHESRAEWRRRNSANATEPLSRRH